LDADVRGKILCLSWGLNPSRPVTQYTDWATCITSLCGRGLNLWRCDSIKKWIII
jgi:hypothetical protein